MNHHRNPQRGHCKTEMKMSPSVSLTTNVVDTAIYTGSSHHINKKFIKWFQSHNVFLILSAKQNSVCLPHDDKMITVWSPRCLSFRFSLISSLLLCLGIPPTIISVHMTRWGAGVMGQWRGGVGGWSWGSLSPSCYKQGPPCLPSLSVGSWNELHGRAWCSVAGVCSHHPTPKLRRASHLRPLSGRGGGGYPLSFLHTPTHTHSNTQTHTNNQQPARERKKERFCTRWERERISYPSLCLYLIHLTPRLFPSVSLSLCLFLSFPPSFPIISLAYLPRKKERHRIQIEKVLSFLPQLALFSSPPSSLSLSMKYQLFPLLLSSPQSLPSHWHTMRACVCLGVADWLAEIVHIAHCLCPDFWQKGKKNE